MKKERNGYRISTGIISIVMGALLLAAFGKNGGDNTAEFAAILGLPGLLGIISGILQLNANHNKKLYLAAAILLFVGAGINFIAIMDISIFAIYAVIIGCFDVVFSRE